MRTDPSGCEQHIMEAFKLDRDNLTLKAMPGLTLTHLQPNSFEKMRVSYAFQLFGEKVLRGLQLYKQDLEPMYGSIHATEAFFR